MRPETGNGPGRSPLQVRGAGVEVSIVCLSAGAGAKRWLVIGVDGDSAEGGDTHVLSMFLFLVASGFHLYFNFGATPDDLFECLLDHLDMPARPAAPRRRKGATPMLN